MKEVLRKVFFCFGIFSSLFAVEKEECRTWERDLLLKVYGYSCFVPSDFNRHLSVLKGLAEQCSSVMELRNGGLCEGPSWGLLAGLAESEEEGKSYLGVDRRMFSREQEELVRYIAEKQGIAFRVLCESELVLDIQPVDLLFIDSLHTYAHLTYELETFAPKVMKYIALHDTEEPFSFQDCPSYTGDRSEYPLFIDRGKRGTWRAVLDFLDKHNEWQIFEHYSDSYGFTILERIE